VDVSGRREPADVTDVVVAAADDVEVGVVPLTLSASGKTRVESLGGIQHATAELRGDLGGVALWAFVDSFGDLLACAEGD
jgi:hypothetical protein